MGYRRFEVGKTYKTQDGRDVTIIKRNDTRGYETVQGDDGDRPDSGFRYNRPGDLGRCTGTAHDGSDPRNLIPERDDTLSLIDMDNRRFAVPFADDMEARLAIMEARGSGGICAGEPAGAFGTTRYEGEEGLYVQYLPEDGSVTYLSRGVRGRRGLD